MLYSWLVECTT